MKNTISATMASAEQRSSFSSLALAFRGASMYDMTFSLQLNQFRRPRRNRFIPRHSCRVRTTIFRANQSIHIQHRGTKSNRQRKFNRVCNYIPRVYVFKYTQVADSTANNTHRRPRRPDCFSADCLPRCRPCPCSAPYSARRAAPAPRPWCGPSSEAQSSSRSR